MAEANILTAAELASVRREYRGATLLPKRTYHDAAIFDCQRNEVVNVADKEVRAVADYQQIIRIVCFASVSISDDVAVDAAVFTDVLIAVVCVEPEISIDNAAAGVGDDRGAGGVSCVDGMFGGDRAAVIANTVNDFDAINFDACAFSTPGDEPGVEELAVVRAGIAVIALKQNGSA